MFTLKIKFPDVSGFPSRDIFEECERLGRAGWTVIHHSTRFNGGRVEQTIEREIQRIFLAGVHWNQRFLGLESMEISVVFQNSLLPKPVWGAPTDKRFLDTFGKRRRLESDLFEGFWYEIRVDSVQKTFEVLVSHGQQLGQENLKKFVMTLSSFHAVTRVLCHLHQFRMAADKVAAGKNYVAEMDRHQQEILELLAVLPR